MRSFNEKYPELCAALEAIKGYEVTPRTPEPKHFEEFETALGLHRVFQGKDAINPQLYRQPDWWYTEPVSGHPFTTPYSMSAPSKEMAIRHAKVIAEHKAEKLRLTAV